MQWVQVVMTLFQSGDTQALGQVTLRDAFLSRCEQTLQQYLLDILCVFSLEEASHGKGFWQHDTLCKSFICLVTWLCTQIGLVLSVEKHIVVTVQCSRHSSVLLVGSGTFMTNSWR